VRSPRWLGVDIIADDASSDAFGMLLSLDWRGGSVCASIGGAFGRQGE
jgi:hypothetical protein